MNEDREGRPTYVVMDDGSDAAPESTAAARQEIAATRERISDTIADIEQRVSDRVSSAKEKVDVVALIKRHPWPALGAALLAGVALSATGVDRKAARATKEAARRAPDATKPAAASLAPRSLCRDDRDSSTPGLRPSARNDSVWPAALRSE